MRNFNVLGDLIKGGLGRIGIQSAVTERTALAIWSEVVGEKTASVTRPETVREGVLFVACRDSLWAQELHFLRPAIMEKLNERLGGEYIKEIRLSGRGFKKSLENEPPSDEAKKNKWKQVKLTGEEAETIEKAVQAIDDEELARRVAKGLEASRKLRKKFEAGKQDDS